MTDSPQTPQAVIMLVVGFLGAIAVVLAGGLVYLAANGSQHDPVIVTALVSLASAALGGLAAMLVTTRTTSPLPTPAEAAPAPVVKPTPPTPTDLQPVTSTL